MMKCCLCGTYLMFKYYLEELRFYIFISLPSPLPNTFPSLQPTFGRSTSKHYLSILTSLNFSLFHPPPPLNVVYLTTAPTFSSFIQCWLQRVKVSENTWPKANMKIECCSYHFVQTSNAVATQSGGARQLGRNYFQRFDAPLCCSEEREAFRVDRSLIQGVICILWIRLLDLNDQEKVSEISSFHGCNYEDAVFWDVELCSLAVTDRFLKGSCCLNYQDSSSWRCTSETSVSFYETTQRIIPEDDSLDEAKTRIECSIKVNWKRNVWSYSQRVTMNGSTVYVVFFLLFIVITTRFNRTEKMTLDCVINTSRFVRLCYVKKLCANYLARVPHF
jgi:hypothetical protein